METIKILKILNYGAIYICECEIYKDGTFITNYTCEVEYDKSFNEEDYINQINEKIDVKGLIENVLISINSVDNALVFETESSITTRNKQKGEIYTLNGIDYKVPFMKDDADGLMQINAAFQLGITETVIYFTNGTKMPIKASEFNDFAVWFVTKRNSFFTV